MSLRPLSLASRLDSRGDSSMIVLGIDPGTRVTGYGAVDRQGGRFVCGARGVIRPSPGDPLSRRLLYLHDELLRVASEVAPAAMAVEDCFYGKNPKSMVKLGHAKGLVLLVAARLDLPVYEYDPRRVKQAVVGNGGATKEQVQFMVTRMITGLALSLEAESVKGKIPTDLTDALAVAVCHHHVAAGGPVVEAASV